MMCHWPKSVHVSPSLLIWKPCSAWEVTPISFICISEFFGTEAYGQAGILFHVQKACFAWLQQIVRGSAGSVEPNWCLEGQGDRRRAVQCAAQAGAVLTVLTVLTDPPVLKLRLLCNLGLCYHCPHFAGPCFQGSTICCFPKARGKHPLTRSPY